MTWNLRQGMSLVLMGLALVLGKSTVASAEDEAPRDKAEPRVSRRGESNRNWYNRLGRFRALNKHQRDHESVRIAFREIVSDSHQATVRVYADEEPVALGCIVDSSGYILTKASQLDGKLSVKLADKRLMDAELIGVDGKNDLAMIKVEATNLPVVEWRAAEDIPMVGSLLASPGMETLPVAIGIMSVEPRKITAPSGVLGIVLQNSAGPPSIEEVFPNSSAEKAGMKAGDVITSINGQQCDERSQLVEVIRDHQPGDRVSLKVRRGDREFGLNVTLMPRPSTPDADRKDFQNTLGGPLSERRAGFTMALQHDTILAPEECGGPLVDLQGRVVGVNIARAGRVNSYALPASVVLPLMDDLMSGKYAPSTSPLELDLQLTRRLEELKESENSLAMELSRLLANIEKLREARTDKQQAELREAEERRASYESQLEKVKAELAKIEHEKTSLTK